MEGVEGGMVDPHIAIEAMCDAIATLTNVDGFMDSPKGRRELADRCRKDILLMSNRFAEMKRAGNPLPWPVATAQRVQ